MARRQPDQLIAPTKEECVGTHHDGIGMLLEKVRKRRFDIALAAGILKQKLNAELVRRGLNLFDLGLGSGILGVDNEANDIALGTSSCSSSRRFAPSAPSDYPSDKQGDVLTVEFTVAGIPCIGLNGGPAFKHNEAFSFQIATDDQQETDRYWNAIVGNGGQESQCGWCKDKWGISWQI